MTNHPNRSRARLAQYGARLRTIDGATVVEMTDPNDNARRRFQYRRSADGGIDLRILRSDGEPFRDGSPWTPLTTEDIGVMIHTRGDYHPILDPLGL